MKGLKVKYGEDGAPRKLRVVLRSLAFEDGGVQVRRMLVLYVNLLTLRNRLEVREVRAHGDGAPAVSDFERRGT